ncbi:hypothetical protein ASPBRDRAFT_465977 [Aspergillus brasiliensis CBS 101740]|uniref:Uncharacterized protein n=1 Tax=Aspergillus brasiliensis (strain CBS 101740 / IMI 381727 / IBT 21946) TaxID=767769 RepID=A0A1L9UT01_ASPBC|nr:hypothetical protein ASPBRDRAFT_465977 [Aspergillus brasiliensis CBS 101740]
MTAENSDQTTGSVAFFWLAALQKATGGLSMTCCPYLMYSVCRTYAANEPVSRTGWVRGASGCLDLPQRSLSPRPEQRMT